MSITLDYDEQIADLEGQLKLIRQRREDALKVLRESVVPVYQYEIRLDQRDHGDKIWDQSVKMYRLTGVCLNQEEVDAVGGKTFTGGMSYLFNTATGRIIMPTGGGSIFIKASGWYRSPNEVDDTDQAYSELSAFLVSHPEGGEVTHLVEAHQARRSGETV
jgi:hypothetical protein